jgi:hypothetical protein
LQDKIQYTKNLNAFLTSGMSNLLNIKRCLTMQKLIHLD